MPLNRYNSKEAQVSLIIVLPYTVVINFMLFGNCIFSSSPLFFESFLYNGAYMVLMYFLFNSVAVFIRNRFVADSDLFKRIGIMLPVFYLMNIGVIGGLLFMHKDMRLVNCATQPQMFWWTVLYGCIISTVIVFANEGMTNWRKWKGSLAETDKLRNAYQRSRLLGLKGQINPHFLFNCFNSLSGLIHDDEDHAEKFLEEMTRVHRYLLRSDDELLVPVSDELRFAQSYLYLTKTRFGQAIDTSVKIDAAPEKFIPPLSMQVILENIIYTNALNKSNPLFIEITAQNKNEILIRHSLHEKTISVSFEEDAGLDNLVNKYRLLNAPPVVIKEYPGERMIILPMLQKTVLV